MESEFKGYAGIESLDNIRAAKNYNNLFESYLVDFTKNAKNVADFGSGDGEFGDRLRKHGIEVSCIETDPVYFANLQKKNYAVETNIKSFDKKFDRVFTFHVLEHIEDDQQTLINLKNSMTADGKIFICVPASMMIYSHFDKKIGHFRRYSRSELKQKMQVAGFKNIRIKYLDSLGFFAILFFKLISKAGSEPSMSSIATYDKFIFPLSRLADRIFQYIIGRHLVAFATL